jgi:transcriptional regulator with XRE-family HTH domain
MAGVEILEQEREAARLLAGIAPEVLGERMRRARLRQGRSIRDLAAAAGLSKTSIVRLEQGGSAYPLTVVKLCAALGLHLASLVADRHDAGTVAVHRHADDRWYDLTDFGAGPLGTLSAPERAALVKESPTVVPLLILSSRLAEGRLLSTVIEVFSQSEPRSHPGEEFVFVLSGTAKIRVGQQDYELIEGESIVFRSIEPHAYAPADGSKLPVKLLSVRLDDR